MINIPHEVVMKVMNEVNAEGYEFDNSIFEECSEHVFQLMAFESLPRFLRNKRKESRAMSVCNERDPGRSVVPHVGKRGGAQTPPPRRSKRRRNLSKSFIEGIENRYDEILDSEELYSEFSSFLKRNCAVDVLKFYQAVSEFQKENFETNAQTTEAILRIASAYLGYGEESMIRTAFDDHIYNDVISKIDDNETSQDIFNWMLEETELKLETCLYPEFVQFIHGNHKKKNKGILGRLLK
eukprot:TRINITY_DN1956_c0_g1_i2.p1 TRINITY_DN1956_c0_g1~~TRINITY_DN1956_c0_g1_i2.p1  ORF type:complete len:239 (-),score=53.67 TRINITY_DN1956_c0_g1_i2:181-897(-)